jgi:putative DNA primase/helicase
MGRDTDSHNEGDVRSVLAGLAELAAEHRCAVLAIRHLRKSESTSAQNKVIGSIAFSAAARAVYMVARDPEDDDVRLVLCAKNNLAADNAGYRYVIKVNDVDVPYVEWSEERETRTADEVLGSAVKVLPVDQAETWIRQTLAKGPVRSKTMRELARTAGHSWRTIERARDGMTDVKIERDLIAGAGATGPWQWRLTTPPVGHTADPHLNGGGLAEFEQ